MRRDRPNARRSRHASKRWRLKKSRCRSSSGGHEVRTGNTAPSVIAARIIATCSASTTKRPSSTCCRPSRPRAARRRNGRAGRLTIAPRPPQGGRAPDHDLARHDQRRHDARPVQEPVSGRDRLGVRNHRLLAVQRALRRRAPRRTADERSHDVEPARVPRPRRIRLRGVAVQLHLDRRQPADRARVDGQHRRVETGVERDVLRPLPDEAL